ncbi:MAG: RagB/SusD family nutrient uptake outer membrane protein [Bacteroidales bacterium]|nr:RagB/SusD family nutrient uptake outer membrane protein [Bacteroidales bacterium]
MKKITLFSAILIASLLLSGCINEFLEVKPTKSSAVVIETGEHLNALLNSYTTFYIEYSPWLINGTDDLECSIDTYAITGSNKCDVYLPAILSYAVWKTDVVDKQTDWTWSPEYKKIFYANAVLENADKVTGLSDSEREAFKREAHFIRAYEMWYLAQIYCQPYVSGNEDKQGLVLKSTTQFDEPLKRATLKETYDFIEADLAEALKIETPLQQIPGTARWKSHRANKAAVNGFAARYYFYLNDYTNAQKYAETALAAHNQLMDYNKDMTTAPPVTVNIGGRTETIIFPYTFQSGSGKVNDFMFEWKEFMYFRMEEDHNWWYLPSESLLSLYDQQYDLRYKYHIIPNYSCYVNVDAHIPAYVFFWKDRLPSGPTTAEMLLIKAECEARAGNVSAAMTTVNQLRAVRMDKNAPASVINLSASSKEEAVKKILEERRREMPFAKRLWDIRRLNYNSDSFDDVGDINKVFYEFDLNNITKGATKTYTLGKNDTKIACPIPHTEIVASDGVIEQNIY